MSKENDSARGLGFSGALQIAFIILKLCRVINWSWFWVLSPIWISTILVLILLFFSWLVLK